MFTNDIKRGMRFKLANGWQGKMLDNKKGNTRLAEVTGIVTEMGSVYAHDIMYVWKYTTWLPVEHTPAQKKLRKTVQAWGL